MTVDTVGCVGLGSMGAVLATNLVQSGHSVVAYDLQGPERAPQTRGVPTAARNSVNSAAGLSRSKRSVESCRRPGGENP